MVDSPPPVRKDWFEIFLCKIPLQKDTIGLATLLINSGGRVKSSLVWNDSFLLTLVGGNSRGYGVAMEWRKESKRKCLWYHAKEVSLLMLYVWGVGCTLAQGLDFSYHVQTIVSVRRGIIWGNSVYRLVYIRERYWFSPVQKGNLRFRKSSDNRYVRFI